MPSVPVAEAALALIKSDDTKTLGLSVGEHKDVKPGTYIPKAEAKATPTVSLPSSLSEAGSKTYMIICLDLDAPFVSAAFLSPILHWIQPGFVAGGDKALTSSTPFVADYISPAPPPPSGPHRYVFLLYDQPAEFDYKKYAPKDGQKFGNFGRIRWDVDDFSKKVGLGEVLAANYFTSN